VRFSRIFLVSPIKSSHAAYLLPLSQAEGGLFRRESDVNAFPLYDEHEERMPDLKFLHELYL